jgi:CheY-like chemotaxis protein
MKKQYPYHWPPSIVMGVNDLLPSPDEMESTNIIDAIEKPVSTKTVLKVIESALNPKHKTIEAAPSGSLVERYEHLHVLVAEDNKINQLVVKGFLKKLGIEPDIAENGTQAIDLFKSTHKPYNLILMDCEMPELDGWKATQRIRKIQQEQHLSEQTKIIALSAHALNIEREKAADIGMDDYLSKPLSFDSLTTILAKHFTQ